MKRRGQELMRRVSRLIDAAVTIDFTIGDEPGSLALAAISSPSIAQVLREATALLQGIREHYEADQARAGAEVTDADSLDGIGAMISAEVAAQEICDIAFITRSQIRFCLVQLDAAIASQEPLQMVIRADDAIRRLRRGLIPLENTLGEFEGIAPPIRVWWDLEISLRIRVLYAGLRRRILAGGQPVDAQLRERLHSVTRHLADVRSSEIYRFLRIDDRIQMRMLYRHIVLWLNDESGSSVSAGRRVWDDLTNFVELLGSVNNRQELQEHDARVIVHVCRELLEGEPTLEAVPVDLLAELENVIGRDDELDALILNSTEHPPADWVPVLMRLRAALAGVGGQA